MDRRTFGRVSLWIGLVVAILVVGSACAPAEPQIVEQGNVSEREMVVEKEARMTGAPAPTAAPVVMEEKTGEEYSQSARYASVERMIIKNAEMTLLVESTDVAIDRITGLVVDYGGYVVSSRSWYSDAYKEATVTIGVPVGEFENVLRRLHSIAMQVQEESASGEDVTDQYVDLEARVRNLEATADRIRTFLDRAQNVEEALKVSAQLSEVEEEIETLKGKLNYLSDRSAYSTITIQLTEPRPTPTPTATATPTTWNPGRTFGEAGDVLTSTLRFLGDAVIWIGVACLPFAIPAGLILWFVIRWWRMRRKRQQAGGAEAPEQ